MSLSIGSSRIARGNKAPRSRIAWAEDFPGGLVPEDTASGTTLGTLTGHDPDADSVTFTIPPGGDPDSKFTIDGTALKLNASLDVTDGFHSVTVRSTDTHGAYTDRTFRITITTAAEGGGGEPEAFGDLNFKTGAYEVDGESVVLSTAFFSDSESGWEYAPEQIVNGVGLTGLSGGVFAGDLGAFVLAGCKIVVDFVSPGEAESTNFSVDFYSTDFNTGWAVTFHANSPEINVYPEPTDAGSSSESFGAPLTAGSHTATITFDVPGLVIAATLNGGGGASIDNLDNSTPVALPTLAVQTGGMVVERVRVYDQSADV